MRHGAACQPQGSICPNSFQTGNRVGIISRFTDGRYPWKERATGHVLKYQPPWFSFSFSSSALSPGKQADRVRISSKASTTVKPKRVSELQSRTELKAINPRGTTVRMGGACPPCASSRSCSLKRPWTEALGWVPSPRVSKPQAVCGSCASAEAPARTQALP